MKRDEEKITKSMLLAEIDASILSLVVEAARNGEVGKTPQVEKS